VVYGQSHREKLLSSFVSRRTALSAFPRQSVPLGLPFCLDKEEKHGKESQNQSGDKCGQNKEGHWKGAYFEKDDAHANLLPEGGLHKRQRQRYCKKNRNNK
jgi:hypothetical protein